MTASVRPVVLLTDPISPVVADSLANWADVVLAQPGSSDFRSAVTEAHAVIVRSQLADTVFDQADNMLVAVRHGTGIDMIPLDNATQNRVAVSAVPGANRSAVAEHAVAQMVSFNRRLVSLEKVLRTEGWAAARQLTASAIEFGDKTIGIVGLGAIGESLARICHFGFGAPVLGNRRDLSAVPEFVTPASIEHIFSSADFVVLTCPLSKETRGMVDAGLLARMKPDAVLVNLARGAVVDTQALISALESRSIRGAILDVFDPEPLQRDSPLFNLDSVVMTPHSAGISRESAVRLGHGSVAEIRRVLGGQPPTTFYNHSVWPELTRKLERFTFQLPIHTDAIHV